MISIITKWKAFISLLNCTLLILNGTDKVENMSILKDIVKGDDAKAFRERLRERDR